jgi:hypothetical protein
MSEPDTIAKLISQHFDAANTPEEHTQLCHELDANPLAAQEFARIARMDTLLRSKLAPVAPTRVFHAPWAKWAAAAALVLVGGAAFWQVRSESPAPVTIATKVDPKSVEVLPLVGARPQTAEESLEQLLRRYYVSLATAGRRVGDVLSELPAAISAVNLLKHPTVTQLRFSAKYPQAEIPPLRGQNASVWQILTLCATQTEVAVTLGNETLPLGLGQDDSALPLLHVSHPLPWFLKSLYERQSDVFGQNIASWLGIPKHIVTQYNPDTHSLLIVHSAPARDRLNDLLSLLHGPQVQTTLKIVQGPNASMEPYSESKLWEETPFQNVMRTLGQSKSVDLLTAPSIVSRLEQPFSIEVIKGSEADWTGIRIPAEVIPYGELLHMKGHFIYRETPNQTWQTEFDCFIPKGQHAQFSVDSPELTGKSITVFISLYSDAKSASHPMMRLPGGIEVTCERQQFVDTHLKGSFLGQVAAYREGITVGSDEMKWVANAANTGGVLSGARVAHLPGDVSIVAECIDWELPHRDLVVKGKYTCASGTQILASSQEENKEGVRFSYKDGKLSLVTRINGELKTIPVDPD